MIAIRVSDRDLFAAIRRKKDSWFDDAEEIAAKAEKGGKLAEGDEIWSEVKEVFILLQEFKCIYCEFPLPKAESTSAYKVAVDYDVEHFRPKNRVTLWPTAEVLKRRPQIQEYRSSITQGAAEGYLRLALDPLNYVVSCKVCNSSYKADRFPIAGRSDSRATDRLDLERQERPFLLFPFGEHPDEPGNFLSFDGPMLRPGEQSAEKKLRGRVVIDFFELDTREGLLEGRCLLIQLLWPQLEAQSSSDPRKRVQAEKFVRCVEEQHRLLHTACGRAFCELYRQDRARAEAWYDRAVQYLGSKDPAVFEAL